MPCLDCMCITFDSIDVDARLQKRHFSVVSTALSSSTAAVASMGVVGERGCSGRDSCAECTGLDGRPGSGSSPSIVVSFKLSTTFENSSSAAGSTGFIVSMGSPNENAELIIEAVSSSVIVLGGAADTSANLALCFWLPR